MIELLNLATHKFKSYSEFVAKIWEKDPELIFKVIFVIQSTKKITRPAAIFGPQKIAAGRLTDGFFGLAAAKNSGLIIRFNLLFCKTQPEFANCPAFFLLQINRRRSSMGEQHLNAFNCSLKTANDRHGRTGCWLRVRIPSTAFAGQLVVFLSEFF